MIFFSVNIRNTYYIRIRLISMRMMLIQKAFHELGEMGRIGEQLEKGISGKTGMVHQHQITK